MFFAAGFETSSITMTLALYELAKNKQIQDKLKEEIQTAMSNDGGVLTYDRINKLEYLECVIQGKTNILICFEWKNSKIRTVCLELKFTHE